MRLRYWKEAITVVLAVWFCLAGLSLAGEPSYSGGQGTEDDPFLIATADDLLALRDTLDHRDRYFLQTANIYLSGWGLSGWLPIGTSSTSAFTGVYDGNGYVIDGLFINATHFNLGLFGILNGATITNLGVTNVDIQGYSIVGAIAGANDGGLIENCYSTGIIAGTGLSIGGLVGSNRGTIENSYSTASVQGQEAVGGLVGYNPGIIQKSYSRGSVTGNNSIGGLVGTIYEGTIENCYSRGSVSGNESFIGGFVGLMQLGTIQNSYSTGSVSGAATHLGGFAGVKIDGSITSCFWNVDTDNLDTSAGDDNFGATGKTTAEMKQQETFIDAGWGFNFWQPWVLDSGVNDGYPQLRWAYTNPPIITWDGFDIGGGGCFIGTSR